MNSNTLLIPHDFNKWPLSLRAREIAKQLSPQSAAWRRIRETLIELADELDLQSGATPQVWPPKANA